MTRSYRAAPQRGVYSQKYSSLYDNMIAARGSGPHRPQTGRVGRGTVWYRQIGSVVTSFTICFLLRTRAHTTQQSLQYCVSASAHQLNFHTGLSRGSGDTTSVVRIVT